MENMVNTVFYFFIYAFLGWCLEVTYVAVETGKYVNRGFLSGPICPVYGVGIVFVLKLLEPFGGNLFLMFMGSVIVTSAVEFVTGFLLEKAFHQRWWDYSNKPFNIRGYVCLSFSLAWGIACLIVVDRIHPIIISFVDLLPSKIKWILMPIFAAAFAIDLAAAVKSALNLNKELEIIDELSSKIKEASDDIGENIANRAIAVAKKREELEELIGTSVLKRRRFLNAFPGIKSIKHTEALEKLKKYQNKEIDKSDGKS